MSRPQLLILLLSIPLTSCDSAPDLTDADYDGYSVEQGDCDDTNPAIHPGAADDPGTGIGGGNNIDEDCNGVGAVLCYIDADNDGFGNSLQRTQTDPDGDCDTAVGLADNPFDCSDNEARVHPDAKEVCDGLDNDCDPATDVDQTDSDGDGSPCSIDCDDGDATIHPEVEDHCNGRDDNCNGVVDEHGAKIMIVGFDPAMTAELGGLLSSDSPGPQYCHSAIDGRSLLPASVELSDYKLLIVSPEMANGNWQWAGGSPTNGFTALMERSYQGDPVPSILGMGYAGKALYSALANYDGYDWDGDGQPNPDSGVRVYLPIGEMATQCAYQPANCLDNAANPPGRRLGDAAAYDCSPLSGIQIGDESSEPLFDQGPNPINLANGFIQVVAASPSNGRAFPIWAGIGNPSPPSVRYVGRPGCDTNTGNCWPSCSPAQQRALVAHHGIEILDSGVASAGVMADLDIGAARLHHWGWDAPPSLWTPEARALFKNLVYLAADCPEANPACNPNLEESGVALP